MYRAVAFTSGSTLKTKADPQGWGQHWGIGLVFEYLGEFKFIFKTALENESVGWETCLDEKTRGKISRHIVCLAAH